MCSVLLTRHHLTFVTSVQLQSGFCPGISREGQQRDTAKAEGWHRGTFEKKSRDTEWNADWKEEKINQDSPGVIDSMPRCFVWRCQEQYNCSLPFSLLFLIHSLTPSHPSSHCRLAPKRLTNLPPNICLAFLSIVKPPLLSLAYPPLLQDTHSSAAIKSCRLTLP